MLKAAFLAREQDLSEYPTALLILADLLFLHESKVGIWFVAGLGPKVHVNVVIAGEKLS